MASCPNCGFDLTPAGTCAVCGYRGSASETDERASTQHDAGAASAAPESRSSRRKPLLWIAGAAAVAVLAAIVVTTAFGHTAGASQTSSQTATPSRVAAAPSPSSAGPASKPAAASGNTGAAIAAVSTVAPAAASGGTAVPSKSPLAEAPDAAGTVQKDYYAPVGTSPEAIRATHAIDLYSPAHQPVYDITKRTQFPPLSSESAYVSWMVAHSGEQAKYLQERWVRAQKTIERRHITHQRILMAFLLTPREWFARPYNLGKVYENTALPIGYGQTISGPDLVARMTDYLDPQPNQRVLEIGTGSGYQSAFLSELSNYVYTIEIVKPLGEETNNIYLEHTKQIPEYANIHRRLADGYYGWPKYAPFDRIIVTAGIDHIPPILLRELKPGGIMVIPIGPPTGQTILKITKTVDAKGNIHLTREDIYHGYAKAIFVPFTAYGGGTHFSHGGAK